MSSDSLDWAGIEADYRSGVLSIRKIATKYGCSDSTVRARAKREGWTRDLAEKVSSGIKEAITKKAAEKVSGKVEPEKSDEEIIEQAVQAGVSIIEAHQNRIGEYQHIVDHLGQMLRKQITKGVRQVQLKSGDITEIDLDLEYIGKSLGYATNSLEKLIKLERQAHNLDEGSDSDYEKALKELADGL